MALSLDVKSFPMAGTTRAANSCGLSVLPICRMAASATAGAPPNSSAPVRGPLLITSMSPKGVVLWYLCEEKGHYLPAWAGACAEQQGGEEPG